ncbi:MAG: hypothetical protein K1X72_21635 [Pyrinomonadaceae bacterium]|nr:hypothetical protein [Pyrinomonadaceae bacterium]
MKVIVSKLVFGGLILSFILSGIIQTEIYGQNPGENFPIPRFETLQQQNIANELREVYRQMQQHLCNKKSTEQWRSRFELLFNQLVIAQHRTLWAAAGYLDSELVEYTRTLQPFYVKIDEIRAMFIKASNKNRRYAYEIQNLITALGGNTRRFTEAANSKGYGQSIFVVYANGAALSEFDKELTPAKLRLYEINEAEYFALKNQAMTALTDTLRLIYSYAVNQITLKTPSTAPLFAVSTSTDYGSPIQILNALSTTLSITFDAAKFDTLQDGKWHTYSKRPFNEADFKGNCQEEKVRILYVPSRRADAEKAKKLLEDNGFNADLREILENAVETHKGKIYYQNKGNAENAKIISGLVKNIESVSSNKGTDGADAPDYSLWLMGQKQTEPRKVISITYVPSRQTDAQKAAQLLRENGFTIKSVFSSEVGTWVDDTGRTRRYESGIFCQGVGSSVEEVNQIREVIKSIERNIPIRNDSCNSSSQPKLGVNYILWIGVPD